MPDNQMAGFTLLKSLIWALESLISFFFKSVYYFSSMNWPPYMFILGNNPELALYWLNIRFFDFFFLQNMNNLLKYKFPCDSFTILMKISRTFVLEIIWNLRFYAPKKPDVIVVNITKCWCWSCEFFSVFLSLKNIFN